MYKSFKMQVLFILKNALILTSNSLQGDSGSIAQGLQAWSIFLRIHKEGSYREVLLLG